VLIEDLEQGRGAQGGTAREAPKLGDAGGVVVTQEDGEEPACDGEADALGLGGGGELGLQVGGEADAKTLGVLEGSQAKLQLGKLMVEVGELLLVRGGVEVAQDGVGLTVEGLAAEAALLGMLGYVAVLSQEDGAGTGEPFERRYDTHG
jgi:hypothetical protein